MPVVSRIISIVLRVAEIFFGAVRTDNCVVSLTES